MVNRSSAKHQAQQMRQDWGKKDAAPQDSSLFSKHLHLPAEIAI
jgi:hypothetical protein